MSHHRSASAREALDKKMSAIPPHCVGVPKREPCARCQLPVFLAERQQHAGRLYHRTCLQCARCRHQLTPGSFYETEAGEFCCETCPDEEQEGGEKAEATSEVTSEVADKSTPKDQQSTSDREASRQSFSHKLALFQARSSGVFDPISTTDSSATNSPDRGLLTKSLSDEEKSKSLKRLTALYQLQAESEAASFVRRQLADVADEDSEESDEDNEEEEEEDDDEEQPPALPSVAPPEMVESVTQQPTIKAEILAVELDKTTEAKDVLEEERAVTKIPVANTEAKEFTLLVEVRQTAGIEPSSDEHKVTETPAVSATSEAMDSVKLTEDRHKIEKVPVTDDLAAEETKESSTKLVDVQQSSENKPDELRAVETKEPEADEPAAIPAVRSEVPSPKQTAEVTHTPKIEPVADESSVTATFPTAVEPTESAIKLTDDSVLAAPKEDIPSIQNPIKRSESPNGTEPEASTTESIQAMVPTPRRRSQKPETKPDSVELVKPVPRERSSVQPPSPAKSKIDVNEEKESIPEVSKQPLTAQPSYPIECNPFGDDEDDEEVESEVRGKVAESASKPAAVAAAANPFDSSDDEVELDKVATTKAAAAPKKMSTSLNPFGSDDDDDDESLPQPQRTPVPTPRKVIQPPPSSLMASHHSAGSSVHSTPEPMRRRLSAATNQPQFASSPFSSAASPLHRNSQLYGSAASLASTASALNAYTRRHKKRAPLPPSAGPSTPQLLHPQASPTPSMRSQSSLNHRTPDHRASMLVAGTSSRKKRLAPAPPPPKMTPLPTAIVLESSVSELAEGGAIEETALSAVQLTESNGVTAEDPPMPNDEIPATTEAPTAAHQPAEPEFTPADTLNTDDLEEQKASVAPKAQRKLIPLDASLLLDDTADRTSACQPLDSSTTAEGAADEAASKEPAASVDSPPSAVTSAVPESTATQPPPAEEEVVYRRTIVPLVVDEDDDSDADAAAAKGRQWQKVKENKESLNKNRQSQCASLSASSAASSPEQKSAPSKPEPETSEAATTPTNGGYANKSTFGKWKRRKGAAPLPPMSPPSAGGGGGGGMSTSTIKVMRNDGGGGFQMLMPLQDIRYELEVIEVQQLGLERQGIQLEKMIRERCEGPEMGMGIGEDGAEAASASVASASITEEQKQALRERKHAPNTREVEDLILQLFEIVNEKNELFRRQAELMYLRRLHRLEQEQEEIEYDIRMLMEQPDSNKTDSDKEREDALIARKIEIVLQRNEVIDCLDSDRLREAEEDQSIKCRLDAHTARWDEELLASASAGGGKLSKKEKKKQRETKKLAKQKKMDADKDADESEAGADSATTTKKKKRKFLF